jgi:hypothetical protein
MRDAETVFDHRTASPQANRPFMNSLPLGQRELTFERFMQQRLDVCLVRQALRFGEQQEGDGR